MKDKHRRDLEVGQLISITTYDKTKYFYIENLCSDLVCGKRVNKDFSFNQYDLKSDFTKALYISKYDIVEIISPIPNAFNESLRTLHSCVEMVLEDFGKIVNPKYKIMLRAVRYQNGSYGIIQNFMYRDMSGVDPEYDVVNVFEHLSYEELCKKWEIKKTNSDSQRIEK